MSPRSNMPAPAAPETITAAMIQSFLHHLDTEITSLPAQGEGTFTDGEAVFRCTASARRVAAAFGGRVVGFYREENPEAEILDGEDGHDFAFINERFVVDYWAAALAGVIDQPVFDLFDPHDRATVLRLYGDWRTWQPVR